jgi:hypothetical protein
VTDGHSDAAIIHGRVQKGIPESGFYEWTGDHKEVNRPSSERQIVGRLAELLEQQLPFTQNAADKLHHIWDMSGHDCCRIQ